MSSIPPAQNNATLFIHKRIKTEDLTEGLERNIKKNASVKIMPRHTTNNASVRFLGPQRTSSECNLVS